MIAIQNQAPCLNAGFSLLGHLTSATRLESRWATRNFVSSKLFIIVDFLLLHPFVVLQSRQSVFLTSVHRRRMQSCPTSVYARMLSWPNATNIPGTVRLGHITSYSSHIHIFMNYLMDCRSLNMLRVDGRCIYMQGVSKMWRGRPVFCCYLLFD
jgi:hypothetical protein